MKSEEKIEDSALLGEDSSAGCEIAGPPCVALEAVPLGSEEFEMASGVEPAVRCSPPDWALSLIHI